MQHISAEMKCIGIFPQATLDRDAGNCFFEAGAFFLAGHMFAIAADAAR